MQMFRPTFLMMAAMLAASTVSWAQDTTTTFHDLLVQYRCPVVDRLQRIYEADGPADDQDRFLIIDFTDRPQDYVQCVFDSRTKMLCEASSGFFYDAPDTPRTYRLPAAAIPRSDASDFPPTIRRETSASGSMSPIRPTSMLSPILCSKRCTMGTARAPI